MRASARRDHGLIKTDASHCKLRCESTLGAMGKGFWSTASPVPAVTFPSGTHERPEAGPRARTCASPLAWRATSLAPSGRMVGL